MPITSPAGPERDAVARAIDPGAWDWPTASATRRDNALETADRILAALAAPPAPGAGAGDFVLVPREVARRAVAELAIHAPGASVWTRERLREALAAAPARPDTPAGGGELDQDPWVTLRMIAGLRFADDFDEPFDEALDLADAALAARPPARQPGGERVRHVRRGTEYEVIGEAEAQVSKGQNADWPGVMNSPWRFLSDGDEVVVYRSLDDGKLWARPTDEFRDGRFETIDPPATDPDGAGLGDLDRAAVARALWSNRHGHEYEGGWDQAMVDAGEVPDGYANNCISASFSDADAILALRSPTPETGGALVARAEGWLPIETADHITTQLNTWLVYVPGEGVDLAWGYVPGATHCRPLPEPPATPARSPDAPADGGVRS